MNRLDEMLDRIIGGGIYLLMWGAFLLAAFLIFGFVALVSGIIFKSVLAGVVISLAVVFGGGYILYQVGKRFFWAMS
jgi:hypothetical protein